MEKRFLKLNDIDCYKSAFILSNYLWDIVIEWKPFAQRTVGEQFVRAMDSVSANIAEGFGRFGKKDKIKFYQISKGSLKECFDWNEKSRVRKLLTQEQYNRIFTEFEKLPESINRLIKFTNDKLKI